MPNVKKKGRVAVARISAKRIAEILAKVQPVRYVIPCLARRKNGGKS